MQQRLKEIEIACFNRQLNRKMLAAMIGEMIVKTDAKGPKLLMD